MDDSCWLWEVVPARMRHGSTNPLLRRSKGRRKECKRKEGDRVKVGLNFPLEIIYGVLSFSKSPKSQQPARGRLLVVAILGALFSSDALLTTYDYLLLFACTAV